MIINPYRYGSAPVSPYRTRLQFGGADGSTTFTDDTGKVWTANGSAQIDTSLGDQRGLFIAPGSYITTPAAASLILGTSDFSIKFTMRFASKTGFQTITSLGYTPGVNHGWLLQTGNGDGRLTFYRQSATEAIVVASETTGTINVGQDYDIEIVRVGGTISIKRDGVVVASGTISPFGFTASAPLVIGGGSATGFNNYWFNGWIKDFRIE